MSPEVFLDVLAAVRAAGHGGDVEWSENVRPPGSAWEFATEAIFVIANSGMHHVAGTRIYDRVMVALRTGGSAGDVFGHVGKAAAMDQIWRDRETLFAMWEVQATPEAQLEFCGALPWIGGITRYHLAKNFGANVAKPDRHLQRLADREGVTPQELCDQLAAATGYRAATVDVVLWRACAIGILDSKAEL